MVRDMAKKISVLQRQRRLQIYRVKNIGKVFELSGLTIRLVPRYGGLLVVSRRSPLFKPIERKICTRILGDYRKTISFFFYTRTRRRRDRPTPSKQQRKTS